MSELEGIGNSGLGTRDPGLGGSTFRVRESRSPIPDPRSPIPDPRSPIPESRSPIPDPRSLFGVLYAAEGSDAALLAEVASEFSPRIEVCGPRAFDTAQAREIVLDLSGLSRLFGDARTIAEELRRTAVERGLHVRVAIAATRTTARLVARHWAGLTVVRPDTDTAVLASLPLRLLSALTNDPNDLFHTFRRWGLRTLGEIAALPPEEVASRLGQKGIEWQRLARGEDPHPLVPAKPEERFEQALDLEWPVEGLEPLSFVLGRLMEPLVAHLERRDRGAAVLYVRLHLVTRQVHERSLQLPTPIRDARTLRTLALLDLESHPPGAAIDRVVVAVDPTPGRVVQFSLLTRAMPSPEQISTLMARLNALMGAGRCGSPVEMDSWQPGAFAMKPFNPGSGVGDPGSGGLRTLKPGTGGSLIPGTARSLIPDPRSPIVALRRFRFPVPARVRVEHGKPARVTTDRRGLSGGRVETCAGPWRTSGGWWSTTGIGDRGSGIGDPGFGIRDPGSGSSTFRVPESRAPDPRSPIPDPWDRDEWDVTLSDGATYRVFRERDADAWLIEGIVD